MNNKIGKIIKMNYQILQHMKNGQIQPIQIKKFL